MGNRKTSSGTEGPGPVSTLDLWATLPEDVQTALQRAANGAYGLVLGSTIADGETEWGLEDGIHYEVALITPPAPGGAAPAPNTWVSLPTGYGALIDQGETSLVLTDGYNVAGTLYTQDNRLILSNAQNDTIVGYGRNNTLAGGAGGRTMFFAEGASTILGGGDDTVVTHANSCAVTTSAIGASLVFLGNGSQSIGAPTPNTVLARGTADRIVALGTGSPSDQITLAGGAATVFAQTNGQVSVQAGAGAGTVVGVSGQLFVTGGAGNGLQVWAGGGFTKFVGGSGQATLVGGGGTLQAEAGGGGLTVFGGTGDNHLTGAAGPDLFLAGYGPSTVSAGSFNQVWLAGGANCSLIAGGGAVLLDGAGNTGSNIYDLAPATGPVTVVGGIGNDTVLVGAGQADVALGGGADVLRAVAGLAGGTLTVRDFNAAADRLAVSGYTALPTLTVADGATVVSLADGTRIILQGVTSGVTFQ